MKKNEALQFAKFISDFLYSYAPNFLTSSEHTLKSYKNALALYIAFLEMQGITPRQLNRSCFERKTIEAWILWLKNDRNCSPQTCNVRLGALRAFLEYVSAQDVSLLYIYQEAALIKRQKCPKNKVNGLSREAVSAILNAPNLSTKAGRRDMVFFTVLYGTAARVDEILSLRIADLHLDAAKPYINLRGKGGKIRTAYLLSRTAKHLQVYLQEFHGANPDPESLLFYSRVGGGRCNKLTEAAIDKRLKMYAQAANKVCPDVPINLHAHQFRHAKATHWLEDGINIVQISFLLGHEQLQTTMKYLDITTEDKVKALGTLENEQEKGAVKKWKNADTTLAQFCGLSDGRVEK